MKAVEEQGFFHEFAFDNKALKTLVYFKYVEDVRSSNVVEFEFEPRHIPSVHTFENGIHTERV